MRLLIAAALALGLMLLSPAVPETGRSDDFNTPAELEDALVSLISGGAAEAHHNPDGILPLVPNTPLIQNMLRDGEVAWCTDARASAYPNFVAQLHQVNNAAYQQTGIPHRQVPFGTPASSGCEIQHTMPEASFCSGCAGNISYHLWPVIVRYKWTLGYSDWRTTQAHEGTNCGHAMGEHEAYDDVAFRSHILTYGTWALPWGAPTVMDFGTHLSAYGSQWRCTEADKRVLYQWLMPALCNAPIGQEGLVIAGCMQEPPFMYSREDALFAILLLGERHGITRWEGPGAFVVSGYDKAVLEDITRDFGGVAHACSREQNLAAVAWLAGNYATGLRGPALLHPWDQFCARTLVEALP